MIRKILFQIHLWSGLILALPFLILGITGAFLVFDQDIDRALNAQKPPVASIGEVQSYDAIAAAGLTGVKGMRVATVIAPDKPGAPAQVRLQKQGGGRGGPPQREQTTAWVDPVDLSLLRVDPPRVSPFRWIHQLHGTFLIDGGRPLVGWAGVAMFIMGLSGLVLWWPKRGRWLSAFGIAKNARGYRFHRDLHGAAGVWLWAAFVVVTFTGVYISFPQSMGPAVSSVLPGRDLRATPEIAGERRESGEGEKRGEGAPREQRGPTLSFDAIYAAAHKAVPDASLVSIAAPARPGQVARVRSRSRVGMRARRPSPCSSIRRAPK
ncbi:MAG: PepSY-associated TM helix domain-containing protein [Alphaproteobacteria bacterium]